MKNKAGIYHVHVNDIAPPQASIRSCDHHAPPPCSHVPVYSAWFAFLLPSYATWKALAHRPVSEPDLERWCMYWAVVGAFVAFEYVTGWILDW